MQRSNIDYIYYFDDYNRGREGIIPPSDFDFYTDKAWTELEALCFAEECGEEHRGAVYRCVCAVADMLYSAEKNNGVRSENIDGYSVTYSDENAVRREIRRTVMKYLVGTGILYSGVEEC